MPWPRNSSKREFYAAVIGDDTKREMLPIVELDFGHWDESQPKVANREVKFGPDTADSPKLRIVQNLSDELKGRIERSALTAYRALKLQDYARIDLRVSSMTNEPYILEVNPNPYLEKKCEVSLAAMAHGTDYESLVARIVDTAVKRHRARVPAAPNLALVQSGV